LLSHPDLDKDKYETFMDNIGAAEAKFIKSSRY